MGFLVLRSRKDMTEPALHLESFGSFIQCEREHYSGRDGNTLATAFSLLDRQLRFLRIIKTRHDELEEHVRTLTDRIQAIAKSSSDDDRQFTDSEHAELTQWRDQSERLHLEMESLFHFAYVALLRAAQLVKWYFGPVPGVKFRSHKTWTKSARQYCQAKKLVVPEQLFPILARCLDEITDPRSKDVVHDFNPRAVYGIGTAADGTSHRFTTHLFPTDKDTQSNLTSVNDAYLLLNDYVGCLVELITTNRHSGRLKANKL